MELNSEHKVQPLHVSPPCGNTLVGGSFSVNELKSNDLRVGNFVKDNEVGFKDWFPVTIGDIATIQDRTASYEPIPITEDILKRLHFKRVKADKEYFDWIYTKSYFDGHIAVLCDSVALGSITVTLATGGWMKHIRFVHQIQNLFYALSGEELDMSGLK